jgi:hypothetical protein
VTKGFAKGGKIDNIKQFGPLDKAEGVGLPWELVNKNYLDVMTKYLDRVAKRIAYGETFQKDPEALKALEDYKDSNTIVKHVYNDISGNRVFDNPKLNALFRVVRAFKLQTLTGAVDVVSAPFFSAQHFGNPLDWSKAVLASLDDFSSHIKDTWETGRIRRHMNSLEMENGVDDLMKVSNRIADITTDVTARNWLDQIGRAQQMGMGKWITVNYFNEAKGSNPRKAATKFMDDFAGDVKWKNLDELTNQQIKEIAARFVDANAGTYTAEGLPRVAISGQYAPLLSIGRWSIEKMNNFIKYSIEPATKGNYTPLLMQMFGMALGGTVINELRELVTGRKQKTPEWKELKDKPSKMAFAYKAAGLISAAGHMGILGDMLKGGMDVMYGKTRPQVVNNILLEGAESLATTTVNFAGALMEDGPSDELFINYAHQLLMDNLQNYRLLASHLGAETPEDIEKANKFRDLRVFNMLEGNKITDLRTIFTEDFTDLPMKKYKKAKTVEEAAEILPELIDKAIKKANNNPEKLKKELTKIKRNSYQTMPNPERMPDSFARYLLFLDNTQGKEKANERLLDYITRNEVNRVKSDF